MIPQPEDSMSGHHDSGKLKNRVALITGGDSGIGRAVAVGFAKEGADVVIIYLNEHDDADKAKKLVEKEGRRALCISGDVGSEAFCSTAVKEVLKVFGRLDILVNNAAEQHPQDDISKISEKQLERTFRTNIFAQFFLTKAVLPSS